MLLINLPAPQNPPIPFFTSGVDLDGSSFTFRFLYNTSDGYWYVRVLDALAQTVLAGDVRIVADWFLYRARRVRNPPGFLLAQDTTGQGIAPQLSDLGSRVQLSYLTVADLAALGVNA